MKVLSVNCGSSSIKYACWDIDSETVLARGLLERVGTDQAILTHRTRGEAAPRRRSVDAPNHGDGFGVVMAALVDPEAGAAVGDLTEIDAVGHRVVHGGAEISRPVVVADDVLRVIARYSHLAPLHNPANLAGIDGARRYMPGAIHVAVFDTAFFASLPPVAYRYAVPIEWYTDHGVRRFGFHGTSHRHVATEAAARLGRRLSEVNLITCHLGNGASVTAIERGIAVDHSMGMTPLAGLMMGTRSGDVDPGILLHMLERGLSPAELSAKLHRESGLFGVGGGRNDVRDLEAAAASGDETAELAIDMYVYRLAKYIGAYAVALQSVDGIVLTGGVGENAVGIRRRLGRRLVGMGVDLDDAANAATIDGKSGPLHTAASRVPLWCIPTDEELEIARSAAEIARPGIR